MAKRQFKYLGEPRETSLHGTLEAGQIIEIETENAVPDGGFSADWEEVA